MMFPVLEKFSKENGYKMMFATEQNHFYPDVTITKTGKKIALDLKSTYRKNGRTVS